MGDRASAQLKMRLIEQAPASGALLKNQNTPILWERFVKKDVPAIQAPTVTFTDTETLGTVCQLCQEVPQAELSPFGPKILNKGGEKHLIQAQPWDSQVLPRAEQQTRRFEDIMALGMAGHGFYAQYLYISGKVVG